MTDKLFKGSIAIAVTIIWLGIVSAALTGSNKAFELAPVISAGRRVWKWIALSANNASKPESDPKPFAQESVDAANRIRKTVSETLQDTPAGATDPRLAVCPSGSVEPTAAKEIPYSVAAALKSNAVKFNDLAQVQAVLKAQPACSFKDGDTRQYRYLVQGFRIIDARQQGDRAGVVLQFTNF
jgi:hypothetical protein